MLLRLIRTTTFQKLNCPCDTAAEGAANNSKVRAVTAIRIPNIEDESLMDMDESLAIITIKIWTFWKKVSSSTGSYSEVVSMLIFSEDIQTFLVKFPYVLLFEIYFVLKCKNILTSKSLNS